MQSGSRGRRRVTTPPFRMPIICNEIAL